MVLLQVQQLPDRRLHYNIGLAPQPPHSSFLGTYFQDSFSVAPSPVLGTLVPCLSLLQKFQSQACPSQSVLMQQWLSVSGLEEISDCSFSLARNPRGTSSSAPSDMVAAEVQPLPCTQSYRLAWVGRDPENHLVPNPLPCTGTPSWRPGCSRPHPAWF